MPIGSEVSTLLIDVKESNTLTDIASPRTGVESSGKLWCTWSWRHSIDKISRCQSIQELMRERKDMIMRDLHGGERWSGFRFSLESLIGQWLGQPEISARGHFSSFTHLDYRLAYWHLFSMVSPEFADRPLKKLCLFDVDGTLTLARQVRSFFFSPASRLD